MKSIFSSARIALVVTAFIASVTITFAAEQPLYNVDFSSPPHTVGFPPVSGSTIGPNNGVTRINFGAPTVVRSFGALTEQPLELRGSSSSYSSYSQIEFNTGSQSDFVIYEMDFCIRSSAAEVGSDLTLLFDTPEVRNVYFNANGQVATYVPFGSSGVIGRFNYDEKNHFRAEVNLRLHTWRLFLNGILLTDANFNAATLQAIRVSLTNAPTSNTTAAVDNIVITGHNGAPTVIDQPRSQSVAEGENVTFDVLATGDGTSSSSRLSYQWRFNGQPIQDAPNASRLTLPAVTTTNAGQYSVVITNVYGSTLSESATLTVQGPARLQNISTRLGVRAGDQALIGGFIIQGSTAKKVIVRAIAPSLEVNGAPIPGTLPDPILQLFNSAGTVIATNDNWRDLQEQEILASTIPPTDENESAIVGTLQPGAYTAVLRSVDDTEGVGLVEVYDLGDEFGSKIANVSTRGEVQSGDNVMIAGVILGGENPARVLVRAIGPSLGEGVAGTLQDPQVALYNADGELVAENKNWKETQQEALEATGVPPGDEREAAILASLAPGSYTAVVRGELGGTGIATVEVYNLGK